MAKTFLLSFDDGSRWDPKLTALLDARGLRGSFNLNSGLSDFVWDFNGFPVGRQQLTGPMPHYRNHEVASHSLHHPPLDSLSPEALLWEVGQDAANLKAIFGLERIGFAVPFTACAERQISLLRPLLRYIRLSEFSDSFALPEDCYHIPVHALYNQADVFNRIDAFAADPGKHGLFVLCGHSYELEALNQWTQLDALLAYVAGLGFENMTTMEFVDKYYDKEGRLCL